MKYFVVDAFADELFKGNPAGVCFIMKWPGDDLLQEIAAENNMAETAFIVENGNDYDLRWFTPTTEIDLCGHGTLASAFIIMNFYNKNKEMISFNTKSGVLTVERKMKNKMELYELDFPSRKTYKVDIDQTVQTAINARIQEAYLSRDLLLLVDTENEVQNLIIDMDLLMTVTNCHGFIVTAPSANKEYDFVSRYFAPNVGINEDHVTGSSHTTLIPFWSERLNKNVLTARQLSKRGGTLYCENKGSRVKISGKAKLYLEGEIKINEYTE